MSGWETIKQMESADDISVKHTKQQLSIKLSNIRIQNIDGLSHYFGSHCEFNYNITSKSVVINATGWRLAFAFTRNFTISESRFEINILIGNISVNYDNLISSIRDFEVAKIIKELSLLYNDIVNKFYNFPHDDKLKLKWHYDEFGLPTSGKYKLDRLLRRFYCGDLIYLYDLGNNVLDSNDPVALQQLISLFKKIDN